ncbi:spore germination protein GerW family protein [Actinoplanes sp. NPDC049599]|uniref:spore germination protein GerW family protein n=1 Tax=Actinoplanes sp. NPDC049599 TaxID=3363903 RepID=UPI0037AF05EC
MTQTTHDTDVFAGLREIVGQADAGRAFGTPVAQDGTIVLPVAKVGGGGGGGGGTGPADDKQAPTGTGGGFGMTAKALGVYVLRDGKVKWLPAVDVNRIVLGGQLVAVAALLVVRAVLQSRTAARKPRAAVRIAQLRQVRRGRKH